MLNLWKYNRSHFRYKSEKVNSTKYSLIDIIYIHRRSIWNIIIIFNDLLLLKGDNATKVNLRSRSRYILWMGVLFWLCLIENVKNEVSGSLKMNALYSAEAKKVLQRSKDKYKETYVQKLT